MIIRRAILDSRKLYSKSKKEIIGGKSTKRNKLIYNLPRRYGRNNQGRITVRHRERGAKMLYREVSFRPKYLDCIGEIQSIEYDPNRSAFISLIKYQIKHARENALEYKIHAEGQKVGDKVISSLSKQPVETGTTTLLKHIPQGYSIHCFSITPHGRGIYSRSAGTYATIADHLSDGKVIIKLRSGFTLKLSGNCIGTIGSVSNIHYKNNKNYKAGQSRHDGRRPKVRGLAMNPIDHPHGGGEGRGGCKRHPRSYTGKLAKGGRTVGKRSLNNKSILIRSSKNK